ncbi:Rpn family recombination-promoting nuclease/putative transposase [Acaryochloris sp. CCMEE 5410]|uniref:Rpn family recombination-promoting nuclease/putative transposase n=1 Tax=Acaryochloris sp. CCMEE 5410 TaxID=310037 RepID=UPI0002484A56|nr:Rpn family recombination-promoting nuclease/putative transposase [Acaryochloris sp. CCMEE 5410]KAI9129188.1 Rpn family recombination-promoting nuclease/putative transposase [Acaryochloris sp. CCMEE 5410]
MFDSTCKFLAESFSSDFASWLLGEPIPLTELSPSELSLEPIRADTLILLASEEYILHVEFQTEPDSNMPYRMADYRLRVYRRFPHKQMKQVVVYLTPSQSYYVYQTAFEIPGMRHEFDVIRLWEQPTQLFLESTGLLPLAVLTNTPDQAQTLRQVAERIDAVPELRVQSNVAASTGILAGLTLERDFINQVLRKEIMQQSVIYQEWKEEFLQEGREEGERTGILKGKLEGEQSLVLRLLNRRIGDVSPELRSQIQSLSLEQLEALGEALLDFSESADLVNWLQENQAS